MTNTRTIITLFDASTSADYKNGQLDTASRMLEGLYKLVIEGNIGVWDAARLYTDSYPYGPGTGAIVSIMESRSLETLSRGVVAKLFPGGLSS